MSVTKPVVNATRDPDVDKDVHALIRDLLPQLIEDPDEWMRTPNPNLGYIAPVEAIEQERWADRVRIMLLSAKYGLYS